MEIKNKLSLEKKSILTLNKVDMEVVQGGTYTTVIRTVNYVTKIESKRWYEIATMFEVVTNTIPVVQDWLHDQSDTVEHRTSGQTSEALATYGGCMVSEVEVICS